MGGNLLGKGGRRGSEHFVREGGVWRCGAVFVWGRMCKATVGVPQVSAEGESDRNEREYGISKGFFGEVEGGDNVGDELRREQARPSASGWAGAVWDVEGVVGRVLEQV